MKRKIYELFDEVINIIEKYDQIVVARHINPDGDAAGSQWGLATWIKDNYPKKKVICYGNHKYRNDFFPNEYATNVKGKFLLIVVDTANVVRCDGEELFKKADKIVKIDHHPLTDNYGDLVLVDHKVVATAQLIGACLLRRKDKLISPLCAKYLIAAIMTDSGNFIHYYTTGETLEIAGKLLRKSKLEMSGEIARPLYVQSMKSTLVQQAFMRKLVFDDKIVYSRFEQDELDELGVGADVVKHHLHLINNIEGIEVYMSIAREEARGRYRVSLRSKEIDVSKIAAKHRGGGHRNAAGAEAVDEKELNQIFKELKRAIAKKK